jgi:hypothetical protein
VQGSIQRQEDNDECIGHSKKQEHNISTMVSPTPNKKARKDEHHDEYKVMKGRLRGEEEIDALLWCNLMTPTNFDNEENHFPMRRDVLHEFRRQ